MSEVLAILICSMENDSNRQRHLLTFSINFLMNYDRDFCHYLYFVLGTNIKYTFQLDTFFY